VNRLTKAFSHDSPNKSEKKKKKKQFEKKKCLTFSPLGPFSPRVPCSPGGP